MDQELLNRIQRYLIGRCVLRDLEDWLLANLQTILDSGDDAAIHLANQIDADFVELGEGLIDEATLREHLQDCASLYDTIPFTFYETEPRHTVHATAAVETISHRSEVPAQVVDLHLVHEFA